MPTMNRADAATILCGFSFLSACIYFLYYTTLSMGQPPLDMWGFRPAQTVISIRYMLSEGAWFENVVPVFGAPWKYPQEMPLYQWIVAVLVLATDLPIADGARLVSAVFTVATIYQVYRIAKILVQEQALIYGFVFGTLWLATPAVVFWGRSPLIESTVIFFAAAWLNFFIRHLQNGAWTTFLACIITGVLAATVKVTAFAGFVVAGFIYLVYFLFSNRNTITNTRLLRLSLCSGFTVFLPACALVLWSNWTAHIWGENPLANLITVSNRPEWYFGTLSDRFSPELWSLAILSRTAPNVLGKFPYLVAVIAIACALYERRLIFTLTAIISFLAGYLIFPQLFTYNIYYEYETAIFLVCIGSTAIAAGVVRRHYLTASATAAILLFSNVMGLNSSAYGIGLASDLKQHAFALVSDQIRQRTQPRSAIVVFGTGWGADVPYLAERKGIVAANWFPVESLREMILNNPTRWFDGLPISAVVDCNVFASISIAPPMTQFRDEVVASGWKKETITGQRGPDMVDNPACDLYLREQN